MNHRPSCVAPFRFLLATLLATLGTTLPVHAQATPPHSDVLHNDVLHNDVPHNDHSDVGHVDEVHQDLFPGPPPDLMHNDHSDTVG